MKALSSTVLVFMFLGFSYTASAISLGQVVGRVVDKETKQPVAYAEITFENSMDKIVVKANEYGYYYADHLPTGRYEMRIIYNERTFRMSKVRVYDNYATELNFYVSSDNKLPAVVDVEFTPEIISIVSPTDILITGDGTAGANQTRSLAEIMGMQPGVEVSEGGGIRLKGSRVKIFIDGTQVMGGW